MTFSALDSALTGPLHATAEMRQVFADHAMIAAMLAVEAALAAAEAADGSVPGELATAIGRLTADDFDLAALGAATAEAGVVAIPFVAALEAKLPEALRPHVHRGATSQDVMDTALVLQMRDGLDLIANDLASLLTSLARLARAERTTPCAGRTYGQHAAPVTFGFVAGIWAAGIADVAATLGNVRAAALTASLGGPVGTLAGLSPKVGDGFAAALGLAASPVAWHVRRARIAALSAWLATLIGALAKLATDVVFLSSTEVGEVMEAPAAGRGGSSVMPHKQNPVASTVILAAHTAAPGLAATLLTAMAAAGERPAGAWHGEGHALPSLFGLASGALAAARRIADGLVLDGDRMQANLGMSNGLLFGAAVTAALSAKLGRAAARGIVERGAETVRRMHRPFQDVLGESADIPPPLRPAVAAAFDLAPYTSAAAAVADQAATLAEGAAAALGPKRSRR